jgi:hypothetical protein
MSERGPESGVIPQGASVESIVPAGGIGYVLPPEMRERALYIANGGHKGGVAAYADIFRHDTHAPQEAMGEGSFVLPAPRPNRVTLE